MDGGKLMTELDSTDSIPRGFLSFSLVSQEIISVLFAFYSYYQGDMDLATFYLAMAALLLVGLGIHSIFDRPRTARLLLATVMIGSYFYLLSGASDGSALLWCLTIIPVLVGCFGYRSSVFILGAVLIGSAWLFYGPSLFILMPAYSDVTLVRFLSSFAVLSVFAIAMDNSHSRSLNRYKDLSRRVDQIAHQDQLTKLPNRHDMEQRLEKKYQQYRLVNQPFSILLADLDNFKFINDRYGHDVGDEVLHAIGVLLSEPLRGEDVVARWGGNEFMVLLPTANSEAAVNIAERLRAQAGKLAKEAQGDQLRISLSVGVASIDKCTGIDDLISTAENGLYQAKHMGRDMVIVG
ncbi:GGDEF domain protein [marine gamma proteobacterium HTCC2207]|jgi:diguanylate cyclase (GGDEF)-like protein|uniref:diguanylate cyclase n=1 Tax=gamma proteobacterium HTCC2207 TaxID=314287 RepID=Q1YUM5_9GAMM|nr:GGDEF domain protein [marine gamma proteobacterium HTCC2207] [gamma proteobacterium HTCC2207]